MFTLLNSDLMVALKRLPYNHFDGVLCDPPYELGFMGKSWDKSGVAFQAETWAGIMRVLKPGAHLMAFGGTRTYHRLTCAIEDAGLELRDCIIWAYGSGFPKSMNVGGGYGTALKPAYEPCILARKPLDGTVANNCQTWGCGALWIDGGRVGTDEVITNHARGSESAKSKGRYGDSKEQETHQTAGQELGRFPANLMHDGSPEVMAVFPETTSGSGMRRPKDTAQVNVYHYGWRANEYEREGGKGSAARFFYCAKASQAERNAGCEMIEHKTPGQATGGRKDGSAGLNSPRAGAGRTAGAKNNHPCVKPLSLCRYLATLILPPAERPQGPRRLLVPFSGSGSEMIGALQAGWDEVVGIEREAEYVRIANARLCKEVLG